ncbi:hypothetical protein DPEC_G00005910 [Dallia pectoralis]|uniref:Uncharacterized protein n=1 Tax=Dallia pectoralis TaxID=75939 RepID=A0ACC2HK00_DALPE|nr:hypothetical protein DPEC_G00005910 [Dallia pectoralis]
MNYRELMAAFDRQFGRDKHQELPLLREVIESRYQEVLADAPRQYWNLAVTCDSQAVLAAALGWQEALAASAG